MYLYWYILKITIYYEVNNLIKTTTLQLTLYKCFNKIKLKSI